jgi:hypothetical protein
MQAVSVDHRAAACMIRQITTQILPLLDRLLVPMLIKSLWCIQASWPAALHQPLFRQLQHYADKKPTCMLHVLPALIGCCVRKKSQVEWWLRSLLTVYILVIFAMQSRSSWSNCSWKILLLIVFTTVIMPVNNAYDAIKQSSEWKQSANKQHLAPWWPHRKASWHAACLSTSTAIYVLL